MSEVLFKAKTISDNEWVFGDLVRINDGGSITSYIYYQGRVKDETVCQYIGAEDKNGTKIFVNDFVKFAEGIYKVCFSPDEGIRLVLEDELWSVRIPIQESCNMEVVGNIFDNK